MPSTFRNSYLLTVLFLFVFTACGDNVPEVVVPALEGRWEIEKALRNGRSAESIVDLFIQLGPENEIITNISGEEERGIFTRNEATIETEGISLLTVYQVGELTDSTLVLNSRAGNFRFELFLRRVADQSPVQNS